MMGSGNVAERFDPDALWYGLSEQGKKTSEMEDMLQAVGGVKISRTCPDAEPPDRSARRDANLSAMPAGRSIFPARQRRTKTAP